MQWSKSSTKPKLTQEAWRRQNLFPCIVSYMSLLADLIPRLFSQPSYYRKRCCNIGIRTFCTLIVLDSQEVDKALAPFSSHTQKKICLYPPQSSWGPYFPTFPLLLRQLYPYFILNGVSSRDFIA